MPNNHVYERLVEHLRIGGTIDEIKDVLEWDRYTTMPEGDAQRRAEQLSYLERLLHRQNTNPVIGELLAAIDMTALTEDEQANVREIQQDYTKLCRIPEDLAASMAKASSIGNVVWEHAKSANDFASFKPHLETLLSLTREYAAAVDASAHPYDVCLDDHEPGASSELYTALFEPYRTAVQELLEQLPLKPLSKRMRKIQDEPVKLHKQHAYLAELAAHVRYDKSRGVIATSEHPLSSNSGRITYSAKENWMLKIFSTLHEIGHAKYKHGLPVEPVGTPITMAQSLSVDESQSRLWENHVGKSRVFWEGQYGALCKAYRPLFRWVSLADFYMLINHVEPGCIRIDADEVTYGLHILLRFDIERELVEGSLKAGDVPEAWRTKSEQYLGVTPPDDKNGCLQDMHWSTGAFGYFPTYLYGSMLATQVWDACLRGVPNRDWLVKKGDFEPIDEWLGEYVWSRGRKYPTNELIFHATGSKPDPSPYIRYLKEKYTDLYKA